MQGRGERRIAKQEDAKQSVSTATTMKWKKSGAQRCQALHKKQLWECNLEMDLQPYGHCSMYLQKLCAAMQAVAKLHAEVSMSGL
jgi:hypothetical protein